MKLNVMIKKDFPIFNKHPKLIYLDNAATTQIPQVVLDAMYEYYTNYKANINRGAYKLSAEVTKLYEKSRSTVANFINAETQEIIFTSGTTDSLNQLAQMMLPEIKKGDNIVLTELEHHANLIPWQQVAQKIGATLTFITRNNENIDDVITAKTKLVAFSHTSNALGIKNSIDHIIKKAKEVGAYTIMDAAQAVQHETIDVKKLDVDFLAFSGHKLYGPTGIGVLYGKKSLLDRCEPTVFGGGMISDVTFDNAMWADIPQRFEAGTPPIAQAIGLGAAIEYLNSIGFKTIAEHEKTLSDYTYSELEKIDAINILSPKGSSIISFIVEGIHPHDLASILDDTNIAVRAGYHCAMPLMKLLGLPGTVRISLGIYNSKEDINACIAGIKKGIEIFS